jgi:hypothetical protein
MESFTPGELGLIPRRQLRHAARTKSTNTACQIRLHPHDVTLDNPKKYLPKAATSMDVASDPAADL